MDSSVLLVHSPLVGPSSWTAAARILAGRGFAVAVPDLTGLAVTTDRPRWRVAVDTVAAAAEPLDGTVAVVGHSGAGAFLPAIGARLGSRLRSLVFVDAVLPPPSSAHHTPVGLQALLDEQTVDGSLRRWLDWWPAEVVEELLPDPAVRALLLDDMPRLPRAFYDEPVPVPAAWSHRRGAYLQLSAAYRAEFEEAGRRGWPRTRIGTSHLAIITEPARTVDALELLLDA
jgi:pimeloyl-ACP methyl ester carboxylesterase